MEKKFKSALPIYIAAAVWLIFCIIAPMYKLVNIVIGAALFVAAYFVSARFFPDRIVYVEMPIKYTGEKEIDEAIKEGNKYIEMLQKADDNINDAKISADIQQIISVTRSIFQHVSDNPKKLKDIRRFLIYFLPTTVKLLNSYADAESQKTSGANIESIKQGIEQAMSGVVSAFQKQLDKLYADQAMDIDAEITVFDSILKSENLK